MSEIKKAILIGAGNVATHLAHALTKAGIEIAGIYSRKKSSALLLANQLHIKGGDLQQITTKDVDLIIISVPDQALNDVLTQIPNSKALYVHTSGSADIKALQQNRIGVFYPLQTFSKAKKMAFSGIPLMLETKLEDDYLILENLAYKISDKVYKINSIQRKKIHIAAIFSSNFTNYLLHIAEDLLEKENIPFDVIRPLIEETANKIKDLRPYNAQTGPAVRNDTETIDAHLKDLEDIPEYHEIYKLLSHRIIKSRK